jgi:pyruvate dehydrogenase E1 component alpha subunit
LIGGPVHLGVGQEAIAVGVASELRRTDRVFGTHRSHSHLLSMGSSLHKLFAEILGKDTGLSKGMGGSMHLWDKPNGFYGSVPIVAGTVSLAVGAALAAKMQGVNDVGLAYFGDGAIEEGVVHESLNLARMLKAPAVFVVENNLFASHMHISLRQPKNSTARFAAANDIPIEIVDGNNVVQVRAAAAKLISSARSGQGPGFLEAVTYRWFGHVDWREDIDVGVKRSAEHVDAWRRRDPIARLAEGMFAHGMLDSGLQKKIEEEVLFEVEDAWNQAMLDPYPPISSLLNRVFANPGHCND